MNIEEIRQVIKYVKEYDLEGITIETNNEKVYITNRKASNIFTRSTSEKSITEKLVTQNQINEVAVTKRDEIKNDNINSKSIVSPLVGVVGICNNTKTGLRLSIGDKIKKGDRIFTVESMKLLNEVLSVEDGIIEEIFLKDGEIVEYNQPVIKIICKR